MYIRDIYFLQKIYENINKDCPEKVKLLFHSFVIRLLNRPNKKTIINMYIRTWYNEVGDIYGTELYDNCSWSYRGYLDTRENSKILNYALKKLSKLNIKIKE